MINTLNKLGVEPRAVEQPLDRTIPEKKMMLAIYLAAPEVENDRQGTQYLLRDAQSKKRGTVFAIGTTKNKALILYGSGLCF